MVDARVYAATTRDLAIQVHIYHMSSINFPLIPAISIITAKQLCAPCCNQQYTLIAAYNRKQNLLRSCLKIKWCDTKYTMRQTITITTKRNCVVSSEYCQQHQTKTKTFGLSQSEKWKKQHGKKTQLKPLIAAHNNREQIILALQFQFLWFAQFTLCRCLFRSIFIGKLKMGDFICMYCSECWRCTVHCNE